MATKQEVVGALTDAFTKLSTDQGKLIEAGWRAFVAIMLPLDVGEAQLHDMKIAYMAGAQHLWGSIFGILDPDAEPTDKDLQRMELIEIEMQHWIGVLQAYYERRTQQGRG